MKILYDYPDCVGESAVYGRVLANPRESAAPQSPPTQLPLESAVFHSLFFLGLIGLSVFDKPKFGHIGPYYFSLNFYFIIDMICYCFFCFSGLDHLLHVFFGAGRLPHLDASRVYG
jgi:hypothetical protein